MTTTLQPPKDGTKEAGLVSAISGAGKTIDQLSALLSWKPHTVRAAFTRLRARGYTTGPGSKGQGLWKQVRMILGEECIDGNATSIHFYQEKPDHFDEFPGGVIKDRPCVFPPLKQLRGKLEQEFGYNLC